ncbi:hypothetical protein IC582_020777 [Cucumis melo]
MDKSWMHKSRLSKEYELGVKNFIKFGYSNTSTSYIRCPCLKCGNCEKHSRKDVRDHLYVNGIDESYKIWFWHGEALPNSSFYGECSKFDTHTCEENDVGSVKEMIEVAHEEYLKDPNRFEKLLIDAEKPLYEGCKKEFANATECPECGHSRWKNVKDRNEERKKISSKVIWYFPPIPLFKRLFRSIECAEKVFNLRSILLWTINDFPAYGNLSGCCVKGYKACPICGDNTNSIRLRHGKKIAYLGHRRFLARDHPYRR